MLLTTETTEFEFKTIMRTDEITEITTKSTSTDSVCLENELDDVIIIFKINFYGFPRVKLDNNVVVISIPPVNFICFHVTLAKRFVQLHSWHIITVDEQFIKLEMKMLHVLPLRLRPIDVLIATTRSYLLSFPLSLSPINHKIFARKLKLMKRIREFFSPICQRQTFASMWCWWWRWSNCDEKFTYHSDLAWKFNAFFFFFVNSRSTRPEKKIRNFPFLRVLWLSSIDKVSVYWNNTMRLKNEEKKTRQCKHKNRRISIIEY